MYQENVKIECEDQEIEVLVSYEIKKSKIPLNMGYFYEAEEKTHGGYEITRIKIIGLGVVVEVTDTTNDNIIEIIKQRRIDEAESAAIDAVVEL